MSLGHIYTSADDSYSCHYLYILSDEKARILYVGIGYLAEVLKFTELKKNPLFDSEKVYRLEILSKYEKYADAINAQSAYLRNIGGTPLNNTAYVNRRMSRVRCVQTGIVYRNATEAARVMQLSQPAISSHLARKPGYRAVKGYTFEYTDYFNEQLARTATTDPATHFERINSPESCGK